MTTTATVEVQEIESQARRLARKLRKLGRRAEDRGLSADLAILANDLKDVADGLRDDSRPRCECGEPAMEQVYVRPDGDDDIARTIGALLDGELAGMPVCVEHSTGAVVGYPLCVCGERARYTVTLWPKAARRVGRYDTSLWYEYIEHTYLMCQTCALESDARETSPWLDGRVAPDQHEMVKRLLRRAGRMLERGLTPAQALDLLGRTVEGGFLRNAMPMFVPQLREMVALASAPTLGDRVIADMLVAAVDVPSSVLDGIDRLEAIAQLDASPAPNNVVELAPVLEYAAD